MDHSGHTMNHSGHVMNHSGHSMDHSGHSMDHSGHSMDHSGHSMDHSGHMLSHTDQMVLGSVENVTDMIPDGLTTASHDMMMDMGMKMYFHFGVSETILFYGWKTNTVAGLIGSMIGIFLLALFYEGLKYFREYLFKKSLNSAEYSATCSKTTPNDGRPVQFYDQILLPSSMHILSLGHFIQTFLHMLQFIISYCLMLVFMTYNVWLCLACTLGAGVGYYMFGWKKSVVVDVTEHCH